MVAASALLTLALLELPTLFGFDYRERLGTPTDYADGLGVMLDPDVLFIARPNRHLVGRRRGDIAHAFGLRGEGVSDIHYEAVIDQNGFRNPAGLERADIALVGDSFIMGGGETTEAHMSTLLAERLGIPVVNLGQSGYGPQQELVVLRRHAFAYRPKTVVWFVFEGNDLKDALFYESAHPTWPQALERGRAFWNRAFLTNAGRALGRVLWPAEESPLAQVRSGTHQGRRIWFMPPMRPLTVADRDGFEILLRTLIEARRLCAEHQARLVVALIPDKFRVYRDVATFPSDSECHAWVLNEFPEVLRGLMQEFMPEVKYVDLTQGFQQRARAGAMLYFPDDTHWNEAGNRAAAEILAASLASDSAP